MSETRFDRGGAACCATGNAGAVPKGLGPHCMDLWVESCVKILKSFVLSEMKLDVGLKLEKVVVKELLGGL